ncbi:MAG: cobalamin B12-binding domain-containing protein [Brevefilum sp.]|nr:cobalamin B12-binding domain-containing protein [Brevefilum sp.]MDT8381676.1 cobalamin B12-binding domain-containing protein [Brevefilum sp.]MDW7754746.1 cobalamin B12-binding domain-containing protein [Brevefilum sp.]
MTNKKIRVLIAKPGLDGHDRGAKVIARALRDAGMEVIYTGLRQTPDMIAEAALQEDVDVVGLSILSGAHNALVPAVIDKLTQIGLDDVKVFVGGIIPEDDIPNLEEKGVYAVYGPGTDTQRVAAEIKTAVNPKSE